jgi:hypothetical protein
MLLIWLQAQEKCKFLRKFAEGWPVRDFMSRYLRNHVAQRKVAAKDSQTNEDSELDSISDRSDKEGSDTDASSKSDSEDDSGLSDIEEEAGRKEEKKQQGTKRKRMVNSHHYLKLILTSHIG